MMFLPVVLVFAVWFVAAARAVLLDTTDRWQKAILFLLYTAGMAETITAFIDIDPVAAFFFSSVPAAALVVLTIGSFIVLLIFYSFAFIFGERGNGQSPQRRAREDLLMRNRERQREERRRNLDSSILRLDGTDAREEAWRSIEELEQSGDPTHSLEDLR